jgi:hypothetical protein
MIKEIWLQIPDYENYYISNLGNVKSVRFNKDKIMKLIKNDTGYLKVVLINNTKHKCFRVHRLVGEMFLPNPYKKETVNHKDKNKENNKLSNLEWHTSLENTRHKIELIQNNEVLFDSLCDSCKIKITRLLNLVSRG